jgi:glycosyltransferase involved in cell wall biosynthesis
MGIVIPAYNRVEYLGEAIESVLAQTLADWELVVVDDGSDEDIRSVVAPYLSDPRISYHRQSNAGRCVARNNGASLTSAEFLCFLDDDDRYVPTGLASLLGGFDAGGRVGAVIGGYDFIDAGGDVTGTRRPWEEGGDLDIEGWLVYGYALPAAAAVRRSRFEAVNGFDSSCEGGEDRDLFLRLALEGCEMAWVKHSVCHYRKHAGNTATRKQHASKMIALRRGFRHPAVPPQALARENEAYSGVHAYIARRAVGAGDDEFVRELFHEIAAIAEPEWRREGSLVSPQGFPAQIQYVVADVVDHAEREGLDVDAELERAAAAWDVPVRELRRARAHREVRAFFRSLETGDLEAAERHRRTVLRLDRRWWAYRTVAVFPVRRALARIRGTAGSISA